MHELLSQLLDILRGLWRFRWIALLVAWGVCLIGWPLVLSLPDKYEASARVFVDPSTALKPVIQGIAIEQDVNTELNFVRQSLLGQAQLKKIVDETGMAAKAKNAFEEASIMEDLRERITINTLDSQSESEGSRAPSRVYTISYQDGNRDRSLKVVQILLASFVEGTLGGKRQNSLDAQKFVEGQIRDYEQRLGEAEQRLADFKRQHVGMAPGGEQQADYFTRLQNGIEATKKIQADLGIALTRRNALIQQLHGEAPIAASTGAPSTPGTGNTSGSDTLSRIKETQARLDDLSLRYTEEHPDVLALRETLEQLKVRRASELAALKRGDAGAAALTGASANPVYQSIQLALNQANVEIAGLRGELGARQSTVDEMRRMLDTMPQVEAEYAKLNRDYTVTKSQYTALVERLEKARLGEEAEATSSVRFNVIDPPNAPFNPVSPKRSFLLLVVLAMSLAAGVALAYALELLRPVFNSARALSEQTGIKVLGVVSALHTPQDLAAKRRGYLTYSVACLMLLVALVAVLLIGRLVGHAGRSLISG